MLRGHTAIAAICRNINTLADGTWLALGAGMTKLLLFLALTAFPASALPAVLPLQQQTAPTPAEGTKISAAQVSGIDNDRLSPGLRDDIAKLVGTPLNTQTVRELAGRIEAEQPRHVAAVRITPETDGTARVTFVVARQRNPENVNTRYNVEDVEIEGVSEERLSQALRDDLHALVGKPLDSDQAEALEKRLSDALPNYDFSHRTVKGTQQGQIKLIFEATKTEAARWLRYEPLETNGVYHSDQGWGTLMQLNGNGPDFQIAASIPWDVADDYVEEYSGFAISFETRKLGTERLGAYFQWSTYNPDWRDATLASLALNPQIPPAYRNRMAYTPMLKFAATPHISFAGGVSITELDELSGGPASQMASAAIGSVRYSQRSRVKGRQNPQHDADVAFTVHAGARSLQSDLVYNRYSLTGGYNFSQNHHRVLVSGMLGKSTGDTPLFERFVLGDSKTLRGWDKFDISPVGGNRMFYGSLEYRYAGVGMFVDAGSVWDQGTVRKNRVSTGVTYSPGPFFVTVAFPVNTNEFHAVFMIGYRASNWAPFLSKH